MTTENKIVANRNNSQKSTGPKTPIGKKYSSQNPVKHGFFSRKPSLSETEKEEFETLVSQLEKKYLPKTPLQHLALRDIAWCTRRCGIAIVLEARAADSVLEEIEKTDSGVAEKSTKPAAWYASSPQDLRAATAWFKEVHRDYVQNHILREDWKSDFDAFFGPTFFQSLSEWNSVSVDDVLLAHMMRIKAKNYNLHLPPQLEESMKAPTVVVDPLQTQNLKEKLLEFQLHHLEALATMRQQRADTNTGGNRIADFSPRYYASAVRDLHRAVEWLFRLKELEGAA